MLNNIVLMGRLVSDPELRYTQNSKPVASFTLAVGRDYNANGEMETDFIPCVAWNGTAEFISKHFMKGSLAAVIGRLQLRDWKGKDGNNRRTAEVVVRDVYFCEAKKKQTFVEVDEEEGDLPF